jgi:hypothetical protein
MAPRSFIVMPFGKNPAANGRLMHFDTSCQTLMNTHAERALAAILAGLVVAVPSTPPSTKIPEKSPAQDKSQEVKLGNVGAGANVNIEQRQ